MNGPNPDARDAYQSPSELMRSAIQHPASLLFTHHYYLGEAVIRRVWRIGMNPSRKSLEEY
jgi:hypothetical protein